MPVRSQGLLLAGMAAVLGLCLAGAGCESIFPTPGAPATPGGAPTFTGPVNTVGGAPAGTSNAFAMRPATDHPPRNLLSFLSRKPAPTQAQPQTQMVFTGQPGQAGYPSGQVVQPGMVLTGQPVQPGYASRQQVQAGYAPGMAAPAGYAPPANVANRYVPLPTTQAAYTAGAAAAGGPARPAYPLAAPVMAVGVPASNPPAQPAFMLRPVPPAVPTVPQGPAVIASSWQPVQHLEPAAPGPEFGGRVPVGETPSLPAAPGPVALQGVVDLAPPAGTTIAATTTDDKVPEGKTDDAGDDTNLPAPRHLVPTPAPAGAGPVMMAGPPGFPPGGPPHGPPPVPREFNKQALPPYVVEPPDILLIEGSAAITDPLQPLAGQHLVRPDGTISLGINGVVPVAGLTIEQIRDAIAATLLAGPLKNVKELTVPGPDGKPVPIKGPDGRPVGRPTLESVKAELNVDVVAYNSKFYYIITDGGGYGAQVYRFPITGNETVLDALSQIYGLPTVASKKKIWLARATPDHAPPKVLPVDWCGLVKKGSSATNYQVYPGDRLYVESDCLIRFDTGMSKFLSPILRGFGATLLGASTVETIKAGGAGGIGGVGIR